MNQTEFTDWVMKDVARHMTLFSLIHNIDTGQRIYHTCRFCTYRTKELPNTRHDFMEIDMPMIDHAFNKHFPKFAKTVNELVSFKIADIPGQQRLIT